MNWLNTFLIAALTAVIGLFGAGFVTAAYQDWYHVSSHHLGAGLLVIFNALLGGIVGFVIGLIVSRVYGPGFGKALACSSGIVLGSAGLAALTLYLFADIPPTLGGEELTFELEIKLPVGHTKPEGEGKFTLASSSNHTVRAAQDGKLNVSDTRLENDRWIIPAEAFLFTSRGLRTTSATLGTEDIGGFVVPLPAHPGKADEQWSEWYPQPLPGDPPWPDTQSSFRFRVRRIPPPPPPLSAEEFDIQQDAEAQAKFDSIPADSPISSWMEYAESYMPEKRRSVAVQRIISKPTFVVEMNALMLTDGPYDEAARSAAAAMYFIGRMEKPGADLIPGVAAAGRDIAARIRKFNTSTPEQDTSYEGAADVSIRFSSWMEAVRALRAKASADFIPELREILELSRRRPDSQAMSGDVRRVASYYLKLWANAEPLPGDPPPR